MSQGTGKPKDPSTYTIVGKPAPRVDLPPKILGHFKYVTDVRVPGMLHGRVIRPSGVGATFVSVDETPAKAIPGFVKTVVKGNFVGVVAENEWAAIQAAKAAESHLDRAQAGVPRAKGFVQAHALGTARKPARRRSSAETPPPLCQRSEKSGSELRVSVPVARHHGPGLRRRGRSPRRHHDGLVRRAEAARFAEGLRGIAARSARYGARHLGGRCRLVRPPRL